MKKNESEKKDGDLPTYFKFKPSSSIIVLSRSAHSMTGSIKIASLLLISASKYVYVLDTGSNN